MDYFDDRRPLQRIVSGYVFGAAAGATAGALIGLTGAGFGTVVPFGMLFGLQTGVFQTIVHSEGYVNNPTDVPAHIDKRMWGGAVVASTIGTLAAYPGLPTASGLLACTAGLSIAGAASIATRTHVGRTWDFLAHSTDHGTLRNDLIAGSATLLVNSAVFHRLAAPLGHAFKPLAVSRAAIFLFVPPVVVQSLERFYRTT